MFYVSAIYCNNLKYMTSRIVRSRVLVGIMLCHQQINEIRHASDKKSFNIHDEFVHLLNNKVFMTFLFHS